MAEDVQSDLPAGQTVSHYRVVRRIDNRGLDIKSASAGPGAIVYEQFGAIRLKDLTTGQDAAVPIRLGGELRDVMPRWVRVGDRLTHAAISPTGVRAAFEARGEIISVPAKKGDARDVTRTTGATERFPAWSPDGQTLAYFSDAGGAYHLELRGQTGMDLKGKIHGINDPAAQTENAMRCLKILLEEAGSKFEDICKIVIYVTDRAYREAVYRVVGKWLKDVYPVSTGIIVQGLARAELLMEIVVFAVIPEKQAILAKKAGRAKKMRKVKRGA